MSPLVKNLRRLARYNILTPVAVLAAAAVAPALAATVTVNSPDTDGVQLNATDNALENNSAISNNAGPGVTSGDPVVFIHNNAGASISSTVQDGVSLDQTLGELKNAGSITSSADNRAGVFVNGNVGTFTNLAGASITETGLNSAGFATGGTVTTFFNAGDISGNGVGVGLFDFNGQGNVTTFTNAGTIAGTGGPGSGPGVVINGFATTFSNLAGATISGANEAAVNIQGVVGTFTNQGTLTGRGYQTVRFNTTVGTFTNDTGAVIVNTNGLGVNGKATGVEFNGNVGSFINRGKIEGDLTGNSQDSSAGVAFFNGPITLGSFLNSSTGTISGKQQGVIVDGSVGTFENNGTITAVDDQAVVVQGTTGTFINTGKMSSTHGVAVGLEGATGTFTNSGTLTSGSFTTAYIGGVTTFSNTASGTITNTGTNGGHGVLFNLDAGEVANFNNAGTISSGSNQTGDGNGVQFGANTPSAHTVASIINSGTVTGNGNGFAVDANVTSFTNSGTITGAEYNGVYINGNVASFTNTSSGRITSAGGFLVPNAAYNTGIAIDGILGTLRNDGLISGDVTGTGIYLNNNGGTIINTGTIRGGSGIGIANANGLSAGSTIINSGTIESIDQNNAPAIGFDWNNGMGNDSLVLKTGSRILGDVQFGGGNDNLDFAGFAGTALLRVPGLDTVTPGNRMYFWDQPNDRIAIVDLSGSSAMGELFSTATEALRNVVNNQLEGETPLPHNGDNALQYAVAKAPSGAETAVAGALNVGEQSERKIWGSAFGGSSLGGGVSTGFGGIVAGTHAQFGEGTKAGVFGGGMAGAQTTGGGLTVRTTTGVLGVYGKSGVGVVDLNYSLTAGVSGHTSSREVVVLGVPQTATSNFTSFFISPTIGVQAPVLTTDTGSLSIAGEASYVGGVVQAHSETAPGFTVSYGAQTIGLLDARLGLKGKMAVSSGENGDVTLVGELGVFGQANSGSSTVPVTFLGQTQNAVAAGGSTFGLYTRLGITAPVSDTVSFTAGVSGQAGANGALAGSGNVGLKGSF